MNNASTALISSDQPVHIVGLGLAGCLLAWELVQSGFSVRAWHQGMPGQASDIAPGLINPLASRKLAMAEYFPVMRRVALQRYREMERRFGQPLVHSIPLLRILRNDTQARAFEQLLASGNNDPRYAHIGEVFPAGHWPFLNRDTRGSFETLGGGWVDLPQLVRLTRRWLRDKDCLEDTAWEPGRSASAETVVHCQGWRAGADHRWAHLPHNPAKGELLWIRPRTPLPENYLLHGGTWLQPVEPGLWRAGARYSWDAFESGPSATGVDALSRQIRDWLDVEWDTERAEAGVRPIIEDTKPVVGAHPHYPQHYIFNGLGSKGAIQGPWLAEQLLQQLTTGKSSLPLAFNVRRFDARWTPPPKPSFWRRLISPKPAGSGD